MEPSSHNILSELAHEKETTHSLSLPPNQKYNVETYELVESVLLETTLGPKCTTCSHLNKSFC
jgi:hypothetical protein